MIGQLEIDAGKKSKQKVWRRYCRNLVKSM